MDHETLQKRFFRLLSSAVGASFSSDRSLLYLLPPSPRCEAEGQRKRKGWPGAHSSQREAWRRHANVDIYSRFPDPEYDFEMALKWSDVTIGTGVAAAECARERFKYLKVCSVTLCPSASVSRSCITDIRMYYAWFKGRGATINTNGSNLLSVILTSPPFSLSLSPAEPLPLMDLCRRAARLALGRERLQEIESLPLPQSLKNYLQYQWLTPAEPTGSTRTQTRPPERLKMDGWKRLIKEKGLLDGRMSTLMDL